LTDQVLHPQKTKQTIITVPCLTRSRTDISHLWQFYWLELGSVLSPSPTPPVGLNDHYPIESDPNNFKSEDGGVMFFRNSGAHK